MDGNRSARVPCREILCRVDFRNDFVVAIRVVGESGYTCPKGSRSLSRGDPVRVHQAHESGAGEWWRIPPRAADGRLQPEAAVAKPRALCREGLAVHRLDCRAIRMTNS